MKLTPKEKWALVVEKVAPIVKAHRKDEYVIEGGKKVRKSTLVADRVTRRMVKREKRDLTCRVCGNVLGSVDCKRWKGRA